MSRLTGVLPFPGAPRAGDRRRWTVAGLILVVIVFLVIDPQWTVQNIQPPGAGSTVAASANLDPTDYVNKYWASRILPTVKRSAVDLPTLLSKLKRDPSATAKRYGNVATLGGEPTFLAKGTARVLSVNTSGIPTEAALAFDHGHKATADLQLGPILTGTDVRDAMRFISFNQFADQVTYSEVATAINHKIATTTLKSIDDAKLAGSTVTFSGAFTVTPGQPPLITPVTLEVHR
jgi:predicted lipoprotein